MRFPHNTKIFRGQLEIAPFAGVFFLLVIFVMLNSSLVFTPGVPIYLPETDPLPGAEGLVAAVAVDDHGQLFFENQLTDEATLKTKLIAAVAVARAPLTLLVQADQSVTYDVVLRLAALARTAGIQHAWLATRSATVPRPGK